MSDDRADRLRGKRNRSKQRAQEHVSNSSKPSKPSETRETGETEQTGETGEMSVKDEQVGTYLYLPEGQKQELSYQYKMLSAEYERAFGDDLEKNRHYYPLVVEYGLDRLDSADAQEIKEMLDGLDY